MASNPISDAITSASSVLKSAFGKDTQVEGADAFRYLDVNILSEVYTSELEQKNVGEFLSDISSSINKMRSSFLPVELVQELSTQLGASINQVLADTTAERESYENAFMRMLGMPDSEEIKGNLNITIVGSSGTKINVPYEIVKKEILNERQRPRTERRILVNNSIYNMDLVGLEDNVIAERRAIISSETIERITSVTGQSIVTLEEVQDSDGDDPRLAQTYFAQTQVLISNYGITNPEEHEATLDRLQTLEIFGSGLSQPSDPELQQELSDDTPPVLSNFSNKRSRQINSSPLHPSLLESIIRIRLDRLSGRSELSVITTDDGREESLTTGDYGILESLFIIRIRSALRALAAKINSDIDELWVLFLQTGEIPIARDPTSGSLKESEDDRVAPPYGPTKDGPGVVAAGKAITLYEQQRIIEDSVMALLDDNSKVLDLQTHNVIEEGVLTQKSSSIKDSHLMSGLLGIVDLPRKRIEQKVKDENQAKRNALDGQGDKARERVSMAVGTAKGIGAVDILIFTLALFTMPEDQLLGLLDDLEYERFLKEFAGSGTTTGLRKVETFKAVNTLTEFIIAGYELLKEDVQDDGSPLDID